jgi:hypothetical protein
VQSSAPGLTCGDLLLGFLCRRTRSLVSRKSPRNPASARASRAPQLARRMLVSLTLAVRTAPERDRKRCSLWQGGLKRPLLQAGTSPAPARLQHRGECQLADPEDTINACFHRSLRPECQEVVLGQVRGCGWGKESMQRVEGIPEREGRLHLQVPMRVALHRLL